MRRLFSLGLALASCVAYGEKFAEVPGVREFGGTLIVRAIQPLEAASRYGALRGTAAVAQAHVFLAVRALREYPEVDEYILRVPKGWNENTYSDYLERTGVVQYAVPNWRVHADLRPNDPYFPSQWHHTKIQSERAWDLTTGNPTLKVGIVDGGVNPVADIASLLQPGYHYVDGVGTLQSQGGDVSDVSNHGTAVAAAAAAIGNNAFGTCGMGWGFRIVPVRITDTPSGDAWLSDMYAGVRWAAESGCKVINLSYSGVESPSAQTTGEYVSSLGSTYVNAAGNDNTYMGGFDWPDVLIVGATGSGDGKASFSNYGTAVDVYAPGVSILLPSRTGSYAYWNGTSLSAPIVAGLCLLVLSSNPDATPSEVRRAIEYGCVDLGAAGNDDYWGYGRINAYESTKKLVKYRIEDLGLYPGYSDTHAQDINFQGQVVGIAINADGHTQPLLWSGTSMSLLQKLGGTNAGDAKAINYWGQIAGNCSNPESARFATMQPCTWIAGTPYRLPTPGDLPGFIFGINLNGQICGLCFTGGNDPDYRTGYVWAQGYTSAPTELPPLQGYSQSGGVGINDAGDVIGHSLNPGGGVHATLWRAPNYVPEDIDWPGSTNSAGATINNMGAFGGDTNMAGSQWHPWINDNGTRYWLDELPGWTNSYVGQISDARQMVGYQESFANWPYVSYQGAVWNNGYMQDLNTLIHSVSGSGWHIKITERVNMYGQIIGIASRDGADHAVKLTPYSTLGQTQLSVSSSIVLEDFLGAPLLRPVTFELKQGSTSVEVVPNVTPDGNGSYSFGTLQRGVFDVYITAEHHLRKKLSNEAFTDFGVSPPMSFTLANGDVNGDNKVNVRDLKLVQDALRTQSPAGDLNGDGTVTYADVAIVKKNSGKVGD